MDGANGEDDAGSILSGLAKARITRRGLLGAALGAAAATAGARTLAPHIDARSGRAWADGYGPSVVVQWNNITLRAIRETKPGPPMCARALAIVHTCIYDAWTAYDTQAVPTRANGVPKVRSHYGIADQNKAISYAAYLALSDLFPSLVMTLFNPLMASQGYPTDAASLATTDTGTPAGIGLASARAVLTFRHADGSNQLHGYADTTGFPHACAAYRAAYPSTAPNTSTRINDPNCWQPLRPQGMSADQVYIGPHWGLVTPFALAVGPHSSNPGAQFRPARGPHMTPFGPGTTPAASYVAQARRMLSYSAGLTDTQKMIAEYWKDGPRSETPPGHWCLFGQFVSRRDHHDLAADVKLFFALTNAVFDAGIAAWDAKRVYNSVRPITAIHYLFSRRTVNAWAGPCLGPAPIDGAAWLPYQPLSIVTPPFPEFVSGHSTFSAAAAEVLKRFTGSDAFGASVLIPAGSSVVEPNCTPLSAVALVWETFSEAADQAGLSRRYGGIHFPQADLAGRAMGRQVGAQVWRTAQAYITGQTTPA